MWYPQVSFRNGEVSPRLDGLSNPEVYEASCRKVEGAIVSSSGTIEKRGGTRFVDDTAFSTDSETNFESTAIKLVPFEVKADTYVLSFEVMTNSTRTWGIIRAVKNDVFHTSAGVDAYAGTQVWKSYTDSHLPFRTQESVGTTGAAADFLPPGGDDTFSSLFGWHHFTAAQLPEVTYFQHEGVLVVCHPDAAPLEVFSEDKGDGTFVLDTRLYDVNRRSPEIVRHGERFTMTVTAVAGAGGNYKVETTRDWFGEEDIGAIYRIGSLTSVRPAIDDDTGDLPTTMREDWDDRGGLFAVVRSVTSPRECSMSLISDLTVSGRTYQAEVNDPYDWDGPWIKEDATIGYGYYSGVGYVSNSGTPTLGAGISYSGVHFTQVTETATGMQLSDGTDFYTYSLVGCILGNRADDTAIEVNLARECYMLVAGDQGSWSGDGYGLVINGDQSATGSAPGWNSSEATDPIQFRWTNPIGGQSLYRLRKKSGSKQYATTVTWSHFSGTVTAGYRVRPSVGDQVLLVLGNTAPRPLGKADARKAIPKNHGNYFDTVARDDVSSPAAGAASVLEVGGTVHVNGGVFAIEGLAELNDLGVLVFYARVLVPPTSRSTTSKYSLGWSHGVGFPGCGVSHQGRVLFSGFKNARQVVVGSHPDRPDDFTLGGTASDGFHFIVNDLRGSLVRWLASGKDLLMGTSTGEFSVTGSPLSPLSVGVDRQSAYGSASIRPAIVANLLLFVQKDKKTLRAMKFNFDNQRYVSKNIAQEHSHFFASATIEEMMVWEGLEDPVVLVRLSDGEVLSCRVNTTDGFYGWSRMKLPVCSSICPARNYTAGVSSVATAVDSFYAAIDDTDKSRLARFEDNLYIDEAVTPATTTHTADPTNTLAINLPAGVVHLNGVTVSVILDGLYRGEWLCTDGVITVTGEVADTAAASIRVGKKISMLVQPRVPESVGTPRTPSTLGRNKNVSSVVANVNGSRGVKVNGYEIDNNFSTDSGTVLPALSQGWFEVPVAGLYGLQPLVEVSTDRPYPAEIVGISIDMSTEG